jgi:hypothetical protein
VSSNLRQSLDARYFSSVVAREFSDMVIGESLGAGAFREVFAWELDPTLVVKFETAAGSFSNVREHDVWERIRDTELAKWFAPVVRISSCGSVLLMKRTKPITTAELPDKVPAFFTDLKRDNWGRLGKQIVCHDYGNHLLLEKGMTSRMRKANWWELGK